MGLLCWAGSPGSGPVVLTDKEGESPGIRGFTRSANLTISWVNLNASFQLQDRLIRAFPPG